MPTRQSCTHRCTSTRGIRGLVTRRIAETLVQTGTTVNVPVPPGTDGTRWLELFDEIVIPEVTAFGPDLVVVSAGFDAHRDDPLAELRLEDETYAAIADRVRTLAIAQCEGRSLWLLEGGYDLRAIAASVAGCLHVLAA